MVLGAHEGGGGFRRQVLGRPIEVIASTTRTSRYRSGLARQLVDQRGVTAFVLGGASSVVWASSLRQRAQDHHDGTGRLRLAVFPARLLALRRHAWCPRPASSPTRCGAVVQSGGKTWTFITADYVFGHGLAADAGRP